jgi:hypothetical protein
MNWTTATLTVSGWYWYRELGKNMDFPMAAWLFDTSGILYASRVRPHGILQFREPHRIEKCEGMWWGPMKVPE